MAGCDPVFTYVKPVVTGYLKNQQNQVTGCVWCNRQFTYLDAQIAPLPYGPKTYFYGETTEGKVKITLDYHSFASSPLPGLIKEISFEQEHYMEDDSSYFSRTKYYINPEDNSFWVQSGISSPTRCNESLIPIKIGVKGLVAFQSDLVPVGTGQEDASLALIPGLGFGQLHKFKKLGGIYYHDLRALYSRAKHFRFGALSVISGINVSGAGTNYVNRNYVPVGFHNEKFLYSGLSLDNQPENGEIYNNGTLPGGVWNVIFWEPYAGGWVIGNHPDQYYYSNQDVETPDLVTGVWSVPGPDGADFPAPTVKAIAQGLEVPLFKINSEPSKVIKDIYETYWHGNIADGNFYSPNYVSGLTFASNFVKYNPNNVCTFDEQIIIEGSSSSSSSLCTRMAEAVSRIASGGAIITGTSQPPSLMAEGWTGVEFVEPVEQLCCPDQPFRPLPSGFSDDPNQIFERACRNCNRAFSDRGHGLLFNNTLSNDDYIFDQKFNISLITKADYPELSAQNTNRFKYKNTNFDITNGVGHLDEYSPKQGFITLINKKDFEHLSLIKDTNSETLDKIKSYISQKVPVCPPTLTLMTLHDHKNNIDKSFVINSRGLDRAMSISTDKYIPVFIVYPKWETFEKTKKQEVINILNKGIYSSNNPNPLVRLLKRNYY